ncbi:hypothetical protein QC764_0049740 [Podospora pseudoanserina]|uniref:Ig-like domain-containing protein n=1 Tax=Podospora pseudoanserina TaxID=2609844 RepID=A0ABR0IBZ1_9PEZI|nr:hypothetical protein QC764_0049740 [Podospora pseudoanserina]
MSFLSLNLFSPPWSTTAGISSADGQPQVITTTVPIPICQIGGGQINGSLRGSDGPPMWATRSLASLPWTASTPEFYSTMSTVSLHIPKMASAHSLYKCRRDDQTH